MAKPKTPAPKNRLRELREERGWSQKDVADFFSVDHTYVSYLESGRRRFTAEIIEKVCRLFKIKPVELFHHVYPDGEIGELPGDEESGRGRTGGP